MCTLFFIGLGIHEDKGMPLLGFDLVKQCETVYIEAYTNHLRKEVLEALQARVGKEFRIVSREFVEDGRIIIDEAELKDVALLVPGDPMIATTHMELRVRAERKGVRTFVVHSSSILSSIPGETGLHAYKFGKTVTITKGASASHTSVYDTVYENIVRDLHTILLLEYTQNAVSQLEPQDALKYMISLEEDHHRNAFRSDTFAIVASRLGSPFQSIVADRIQSLLGREYGDPPHVIIIPARLHFTEIDSLKTLLKIDETQITDNSRLIRRIANSMVEKYVEKTRRALMDAHAKTEADKSKFNDLFENVSCYLSDSERFLKEGKAELAILSIGYAEGLLDSIRYTHGLELNW